MSEVKTNPGISRRSFLKTTAAVAGVAAATGGVSTALAAYNPGQIAGSGETIVRGLCRPNCFAFCHLNLHVRDGKLVKTSRAPYNEPELSRICHRGLSQVQRVYDPARITKPLKRKEGTERGAGEWEVLTWDEAFTQVAAAIKSAQDKYGKGSVAGLSISGNMCLTVAQAYGRFWSVIGASSIAPDVDNGSTYGFMRHTGAPMDFAGYLMWEANEVTDAHNAKTIVAWGSNATDAQIQNWHLLKEAKQGGTKLVHVDPIFNVLASKADWWIPIRPATDTVLKYGVMYQILAQGKMNEAFMRDKTVAPFLVRSDNKMFLRVSDFAADMPTPEPPDTSEMSEEEAAAAMAAYEAEIAAAAVAAQSTFLGVVDGVCTPITPDVQPSLEGEVTVPIAGANVKCRTAFSILKDEIVKWTPEAVEAITDVAADDVVKFANICMDIPVYHYEGLGPQAWNNGTHPSAAGITMCAMLGNLGFPGASHGSMWGVSIATNAAYTAPVPNTTGITVHSCDLANFIKLGHLQGVPGKIKVIWNYTANPVNTTCDTNVWLNEIIPSLDCMITADWVMTDTARFSDFVLPVAQWFEYEDIGYAGATSCFNISEKAIEPLGDSLPDYQIIAGVAQKLGVGEYFTDTGEQILRKAFEGLGEMMGFTYDRIKAEKQVRYIAGDAIKDPHIAWRGGTFPASPYQRLSFYLEAPEPRAITTKTPTPEEIERERIPRFFPPMEGWYENPKMKEYPIILMSERPRYRVHSQWATVPLLREIDPEPIVRMNPADCQARGIADGDYVECYNDRGHAVAKVLFSESIRPGCAVYPKGWSLEQHIAGGWSELSNTDFDVWTVNYNFMDVLCEVRPWKGGVK